MTPGVVSGSAGPRLDALAEYLTSLGLAEYGDFYVRGRIAGLAPSSEHVAISDREGVLKVWYRDMGVQRVLVETSDFEVARERFVREAVALALSRGRRVAEH